MLSVGAFRGMFLRSARRLRQSPKIMKKYTHSNECLGFGFVSGAYGGDGVVDIGDVWADLG